MTNFKKHMLAIALIYVASFAFSQNLDEYKWGTASYKTLNEKYQKDDQAYILRTQKLEANFDESKQTFERVLMNHFIIQVNTEKGLKLRRELEPPSESPSTEVLEFKLRIIHPNGEVKEFKKSDLKEKKESERPTMIEEGDDIIEEDDDDDDDDTYTYYDLGELKEGSQFEFFFILRIKNPNMSGSLLNYQSRIPIQEFNFELSATKEFSFLFKSYNGAPQIVKDSTNKIRSVYQMSDQMVDALPKEKFSNFGANLRGVVYKLDGFELGKKRNIFNNEDFSRNFYNYFYAIDKKEKAVIKKVMKGAKVKSFKTDDEKVLALENYIKSNFAVFNINALNGLFDIENLYNYNSITGENAARIIATALTMMDIEHELAVTCDRFDYRFDKDFSTSYFMDYFLIYLPSSQKYLDPNVQGMRLGLVPGNYTHNHGLFIRAVSAGGVTSGVGKVKFINALGKDDSIDKIEVKATISDDLKSTKVNLTRTMTGYFAADWQPYFNRVDAEQRVKYDNALFRFIDEKMEIEKTEYLNTDKKDIQVKPFIIKGIGTSENLLDINNDTLIFKIGKLIGKQADLYEEEERKLEIERHSARTYDRHLSIELPAQYRIQNLEDLNKTFELKNEKGKVAAYFKSTYELSGDILQVRIEEWFEDIILPAAKYEVFKNIINAAADFHNLELTLFR